VTGDELDGANLDITCHVNGELRQHSNTHHLIFDCIDQIEYLSQVMTLEPGDAFDALSRFCHTPRSSRFSLKVASKSNEHGPVQRHFRCV
jgi:hypothetical protein